MEEEIKTGDNSQNSQGNYSKMKSNSMRKSTKNQMRHNSKM